MNNTKQIHMKRQFERRISDGMCVCVNVFDVRRSRLFITHILRKPGVSKLCTFCIYIVHYIFIANGQLEQRLTSVQPVPFSKKSKQIS